MSEVHASASPFPVAAESRSEEVALLLVVLFGPVGLLYTSVRGGVALTVLALVGALLTMGFAPLAVWPVCILWVLIAGAMHKI
jgi:hypothetical protein